MGEKNEHQDANAASPQADENAQANQQTADVEEILGEEAEGEIDVLTGLVEDLKKVHEEKEDLQDQILRSAAEMENLRRRTRKDVADAREFSIAGFARDLLSVGDNLRRAIDAVPQEEAAGDNAGLKSLIEGVEMTERELINTLEKHGVKKITPTGEKFDPNFHQAMYEVPNTEVINNTVLEVVQDGYVIGERVLRPAMVGVSKGGPKASVEPEPDNGEEPEQQAS